MGLQEIFEAMYRKFYKKILIVPFILFLVYLYLVFVSPGVRYGMDFRGGILVSFTSDSPISVRELEEAIRSELGVSDVTVTPTVSFEGGKEIHGGIVEVVYPKEVEQVPTISAEMNEGTPEMKVGEEKTREDFQAKVLEIIKKTVGKVENVTVREVTPSLGKTFWDLAVRIALMSFMLLLVSVFLFFRKGTPTLIMIGSAVFDLLGMVALMALFNIPLNLDTITILLMMVGYSIDTDIVLSTHLLKRGKEEGDAFARAARAADTGMHMSGTTLIAMIFIYIVGYLTRNLAVMRIANVMVFGLISDIIVTWFLNAPVMISLVRKDASAA